ncbi:MAG: SEC-C domain-containing protein [Bacteroidales bacterium]|nr:SEC-C domain-containing protein [Bacteroidales bacterium]
MTRIEKQYKEIEKVFPKLKLVKGNSFFSIQGTIEIIDKERTFWDSFDVDIKLKNFPSSFPQLFETSNKIPKVADRHIYTDTGACCVCGYPQMILATKRSNFTIKHYIDEYVIPCFANQIYFEKTGKWKNGEYSHGDKGIVEAYLDLLKLNNEKELLVIIQDYLLKKYNIVGRNDKCICGSNRKYKKCCADRIQILNTIGENEVAKLKENLNDKK